MKILHFIPSIDEKAGINSKYMSVLAENMGKDTDIHIACAKTPSPIEIKNATIHFIHCGNRDFLKMRREWICLLYKIMPDIVHIHGCWTIPTSRVLLMSNERGFRTVLSPHGELESWMINQKFWTNRLPKIIAYQFITVRMAFAIHVMGHLEYENLKRLKWNDRIDIVPNSLITESITDKEMGKMMSALYQKVLDTDVIKMMDKNKQEAFSMLLHAGLTNEKLMIFPKLDEESWRQIMILAKAENVYDIISRGCELQPYTVPYIDIQKVHSFNKKKDEKDGLDKETVHDICSWRKKRINKFIKKENEKTKSKKLSTEMTIVVMMTNLKNNLLHHRISLKQLCELAIIMRGNDYDEGKLSDILHRCRLRRFAGRLEQILNELTGFEEGFMPVPIVNDFITEKIRQIIINY